MANCSLAITIDGWQADGDVAPTFREGDPITGTVHVWVTDEVRCDGLDVRLELEKTTRGFTLPDGPPPVRVFSGTWKAGEYEYRFELPSGFPPTYHGFYVGWRWVVRATADIPWAGDPEAKSPFELEPAPGSGELTVRVPAPDGVQPGATSKQFGAIWALAIAFILAFATLITGAVLHLTELMDDEMSGDIAGFGMLGSVGLGSALVSVWLRRTREPSAANRWRASVTLARARPVAGYRAAGDEADGVDCEVRTRGGGVVERVTAELVVREYVYWTENDLQTETSARYEREKVLAKSEVPLAGDSATGSWRGRLPLPELDPRTPRYTLFDDLGRGLLWQVNVLSFAKGREKPDVETRYLTVRPGLTVA